jgi:phosphatidylinositol glycan class W
MASSRTGFSLQANSAYVLWIAAFNVTFIMLYLMVDEAFKPKTSGPSLSAPSIFLAINKNGLVVFLVVSPHRILQG